MFKAHGLALDAGWLNHLQPRVHNPLPMILTPSPNLKYSHCVLHSNILESSMSGERGGGKV